jgi:hypothetical protein
MAQGDSRGSRSLSRHSDSVPIDCDVILSFPLVGNPSKSEERFWTSQNDRTRKRNRLLKSFLIFIALLL